ncbi:MAG: hypothetical protein ACO3N7_00670 [Kiritimatiellia bacterium]
MQLCWHKPVLVAGFFWVFFPQLPAQIELQDVPEQSGEPSTQVPANSEATEAAEKDLENMIRQLKRAPSAWVMPDQTPDSPELERLQARMRDYAEAPRRVIVGIQFVNGEWQWGEVSVFSFKVSAEGGIFPVILHQLQKMERRDRDAEDFVLNFRDGDLLQGRPEIGHVPLQLPQGGVQQIPMEKIRQIQISERNS